MEGIIIMMTRKQMVLTTKTPASFSLMPCTRDRNDFPNFLIISEYSHVVVSSLCHQLSLALHSTYISCPYAWSPHLCKKPNHEPKKTHKTNPPKQNGSSNAEVLSEFSTPFFYALYLFLMSYPRLFHAFFNRHI